MIKMIIYKATNIINDKVYIGQTKNSLKIRKRKHINDMRKSNTYFSNALNKYGSSKFVWEVIEDCESKEELDEMEFHYIKQYNSLKPNGYNMTLGGEGSSGYRHSSRIRKKMSKASMESGNHVNRGKHLSKEWRKKISESNIGKVISAEHRDKISKSKQGEYVGKDSKCSKKFVIITPLSEEFCIIGLANFSRKYKNGLLDFRLLSAVANGKRNHHKGYKCRHYNPEVDFNIPEYDRS
jgi:group I intron endonuclease